MNQEAWQKVETAIAATKDTTIKQLFAADPDRAAKYTLSAAGWRLDYSKNRIDAKVMKALVKLAEASNLKAEIEKMFTGKKINERGYLISTICPNFRRRRCGANVW